MRSLHLTLIFFSIGKVVYMQNIAKGLGDLEKRIRKDVHAAIEETLEAEVFDAVRDTVINRVHKDVYGVYTPKKIHPKEG